MTLELARATIAAGVDLNLVRITPTMTVEQIERLCRAHNAHCLIESIANRPVGYLIRNADLEHVPAFLRRQAT